MMVFAKYVAILAMGDIPLRILWQLKIAGGESDHAKMTRGLAVFCPI